MKRNQAKDAQQAQAGFYERSFDAQERVDLAAALQSGLSSEIAMLRVTMRRFYELLCDSQQPEELGELLGRIGLGAMRLSALLEKQHGSSDEGAMESLRLINKAIDQAAREMGIKE
jgi:hypothetical protein